MSEAKTGCRWNAALPHDPLFLAADHSVSRARYASGKFGATAYRKRRSSSSRRKIEHNVPGLWPSIRRAIVVRMSTSGAPARMSFKESKMLSRERVCERLDEVWDARSEIFVSKLESAVGRHQRGRCTKYCTSARPLNFSTADRELGTM